MPFLFIALAAPIINIAPPPAMPVVSTEAAPGIEMPRFVDAQQTFGGGSLGGGSIGGVTGSPPPDPPTSFVTTTSEDTVCGDDDARPQNADQAGTAGHYCWERDPLGFLRSDQ